MTEVQSGNATFKRGRNERASRTTHNSVGSTSQVPAIYTKPAPMDYLKKGEQRESSRDFISFSRQILLNRIAINDKNAESERLHEYITMEKEKLAEAEKFLHEDRTCFE